MQQIDSKYYMFQTTETGLKNSDIKPPTDVDTWICVGMTAAGGSLIVMWAKRKPTR